MKSIKLYGIKYESSQMLDERFEEYFNEVKTIEQNSFLFEYNVLIDIIDNHNVTEEYLGIFSYKFPLKTNIFYKKLIWMLNNNPNYDCYGLCPQHYKGNYLKMTEKYHPLFKNCMDIICKKFNLEYKEPKYAIYSNFFILKTELYKEYVNFLKEVIDFMEKNEELKTLLWQDFNYPSGLSKELLKEKTELNFYTGHTFCLERIANLWLMKNKIEIKQLL